MNGFNEHFLVVGLRGLILHDILGIMERLYPSLVPLTARSLEDAAGALADRTGVVFAFLNLGPDQLVADEISELLKRLGARIILMGSDAEDAPTDHDYPVLTRPFTEEDVSVLLKASD